MARRWRRPCPSCVSSRTRVRRFPGSRLRRAAPCGPGSHRDPAAIERATSTCPGARSEAERRGSECGEYVSGDGDRLAPLQAIGCSSPTPVSRNTTGRRRQPLDQAEPGSGDSQSRQQRGHHCGQRFRATSSLSRDARPTPTTVRFSQRLRLFEVLLASEGIGFEPRSALVNAWCLPASLVLH